MAEVQLKLNCSRKIFSGYHSHFCTNLATITVDGKSFCGLHSPAAEARRQKKADDRREVWANEHKAKHAIQQRIDKLLILAQGIPTEKLDNYTLVPQ